MSCHLSQNSFRCFLVVAAILKNCLVNRSFRSFSAMSIANGVVGRVTMKRMENGEWRMQSTERTPEGIDKDHASTSKQQNSPGNSGSRGPKLNFSEIVENAKRTLGEADAEGNAADRKRHKSPWNAASCIQWKMWLVKNYTVSAGSVVAVGDIIEHSEKEKESFEMPVALNSFYLSVIAKDTWGGKVKKVRRGSRSEQKRCLKNVARIQYQMPPADLDFAREFEDLAKDDSSPKGWLKIVDCSSKISFVCPETWEFDNQRIYKEITMELSSDKKVVYSIKSHGSEISLAPLNVEKIIQDLPIKLQVTTIIAFVESSHMCLGYRVPPDGNIITLKPHKAGILKSLSNNEILPQKGAFSLNCQIFSHARTPCLDCSRLKRSDANRKRRKESRKSISIKCNKRYLTKEEIQQQLKDEQKLKKKYQQESQERQATDTEDDENVSRDSDAEEDDEEEEDEEEED